MTREDLESYSLAGTAHLRTVLRVFVDPLTENDSSGDYGITDRYVIGSVASSNRLPLPLV